MQTIQQERAKYALAKVQESIGKYDKEYKSYASSLPAMIHMNGLARIIHKKRRTPFNPLI